MFIKRVLTMTGAIVVLGGGLQVLGMQAAFADAGGQASCVGLESSSIAPPGSSDEFAGGRAELEQVIHQLAQDAGLTPGAIVGSLAQLHEGSHAGCDEATE